MVSNPLDMAYLRVGGCRIDYSVRINLSINNVDSLCRVGCERLILACEKSLVNFD